MHPDADLLEQWVLGSAALDAEAEAHVRTCAECKAKAASLLGHTHQSPPTPAPARDGGTVSSGDDATSDTLHREGPPAAAPPPQSLQRGAQLGRYVVLELLGAGGMGEVYAAYDPELDRKVALKVIRHGAFGGSLSTEGRARMQREAQALARLSHRNVVAVHDVGAVGGQVFIALEFVEGETLKAWLRQPRPVPEILRVFREAGEGLAAAHGKGLIHRDFKPENVLLSHQGEVRVSDFGLARAAGDRAPEAPGAAAASSSPTPPEGKSTPSSLLEAGAFTVAGAVMGTPGYMAPEQYRGQPATDRSDQFAFCVALYEALYGRRPFAGRTLVELASSSSSGDVPPPPEGSKAPAYLWPILRKGLSPKADDRHPSMRELLDALLRDPRRVLVRRARSAAVALAVVLAFLGFAWNERRREAVCANQKARLAGVWDKEKRSLVRDAFQEAAGGAGQTAFDALVPTLDAYGTAWVAQQTDACRAARIRGEQTLEMLSVRTACLDARLGELRALVEVLEHADGPAVDQSSAAARSLHPLDGCADLEALMRGLPPPTGEQRPKVEAAQAALDRAEAKFLAGDAKGAEAGLAAATAGIEGAGYGPLDAEAHLFRASLLDGRGSYAGAEREVEEAIHVAEASRHEEVLIRAWAFRAMLFMQRLGRREDGAEAMRHATSLLSARSRRDPALEADVEQRQGMLLLFQGDATAAAEHLSKALSLRQAALPPGHPDRIASLNAMGNVLRRAGHVDEAMARYSEALKEAEAAYGPDHPGLIDPLTSIGVTFRREGRLDDSYQAFTRALKLREKSSGPEHPLMAPLLTSFAQLLEDLGRFDEAGKALQRALEISRKSFGQAHPTTARVLMTMCDLEDRRGDHQKALELSQEALQARERSNDTPARIANALVVQGGEELHLGQWRTAKPLLESAVKMLDEGRDAGQMGLGRGYLAQVRWEQGKPKEAAELARSADELLTKAGGMERERKALRDWLAAHRL